MFKNILEKCDQCGNNPICKLKAEYRQVQVKVNKIDTDSPEAFDLTFRCKHFKSNINIRDHKE